MTRQLISFPKSGRSWVRFALHHLGVAEQVTFHHDTFEYNDGAKPRQKFDFNERAEKYAGTGPLVYVHRDPRDVMVSLFHQVTGRFAEYFQYTGTISDFLRDDYFGAHNLKMFQDQWDELCRRGVALRVTYENCHADFEGTLRAIVDHYGFDVTDEAIAAAKEASSFESMKRIEASNEFAEPWLRAKGGASKVRRGKVGGFRDTLSAADIAFLNAMFEIDEAVAAA